MEGETSAWPAGQLVSSTTGREDGLFTFEASSAQFHEACTQRERYQQELRTSVQKDIEKTLNKSKAYVKAKQGPPRVTQQQLEFLSAPKPSRMHREDQARTQLGIRDHCDYAALKADTLQRERERNEAMQQRRAQEEATKQQNVAAYKQYKAAREQTKKDRIASEKAAAAAYGKAVSSYVNKQAAADLTNYRERKERERAAAAARHEAILTQNFHV